MIILDPPYVSDELRDFITQTNQRVLRTPFAESALELVQTPGAAQTSGVARTSGADQPACTAQTSGVARTSYVPQTSGAGQTSGITQTAGAPQTSGITQTSGAPQTSGTAAIHFCTQQELCDCLARGERLYTASENSLEWVLEHVENRDLCDGVRLMKDKARMRELLSPLSPDLFFHSATLDGLYELKANDIPFPVVVKPRVGFFSVGVHVVQDKAEWDAALRQLSEEQKRWSQEYPRSVVDTRLIVEGYIEGQEYAIDAYFNAEGVPVVLNVMQHDFSGGHDVSDRLYYTGAALMREWEPRFTEWLLRVNALTKLHDFPFHVELRVSDNGSIVPIEFNPLRFAGWCTTDLSYFAYGFKTYDYYLNDICPDWDSLLVGKEGKFVAMVIMEAPHEAAPNAVFDYDACARAFGRPLCVRRIDWHTNPVAGFFFEEIDEHDTHTLSRIVSADVSEFMFCR